MVNKGIKGSNFVASGNKPVVDVSSTTYREELNLNGSFFTLKKLREFSNVVDETTYH